MYLKQRKIVYLEFETLIALEKSIWNSDDNEIKTSIAIN